MLLASDLINIENHVDQVRKSLNLHHIDNIDLMTAIVHIKRLFPSFDYSVEKINGGQIKAQFQRQSKRDLIVITPDTFSSMNRNQFDGRLAVAHEIGHFYLGHHGTLNFQNDRNVTEREVFRVSKSEAEADYFGMAFLIPASISREILSAKQLQSRFWIDAGNANKRFEQIETVRNYLQRSRRTIPDHVMNMIAEMKKNVRR